MAVSSHGKELPIIAQREGVKTIAVDMERHMAPFKDLVSLFKLIKVFRKERPHMVHSITPKAGLLSMMAAKIARVPVRLHTFTGLVFPTATGLTQKILILTDRLTCACATHIVPEGEGVKQDLINYHITRKPLQILGYGNIRGIDLTHYDRTQEVMSQAQKIRNFTGFTFIFIGRIVADKGINELIDAFCRLYNRTTEVRLILVGNFEEKLDPLKPETLQKIKTNPNIILAGHQKDVRPWLAAADALVFPSYREGFPNVVIEAGAMGIPAIVTDINGSREIIVDGFNGAIIPPRDSNSLLKAMQIFATDPELVEKLARNCRPLMAKCFEQSYVRRCLKDYYHKILKEKSILTDAEIAAYPATHPALPD